MRKAFFLHAAELIASVRCCHTASNPVSALSPEELHSIAAFPLRTQWTTAGCRVARWVDGFDAGPIQVGDQVLSINGRDLDEWMTRSEIYVSGQTPYIRKMRLAQMLPIWLYLIDGPVSSFQVRLQGPQGEYQVEIPAVVLRPRKPPGPDASFWLEGKVCLLKLPYFWRGDDKVRGTSQTWQQFVELYDRTFADMGQNNTELLIVDLRGNGGGDAWLGSELIRRLATRPWGGAEVGAKRWRYSDAYRHALLLYGLEQRGIPRWLGLELWLRLEWFYQPGQFQGWQQEGDTYISPGMSGVQPTQEAWPGRTVVLVDSETFSAAKGTAWTFKQAGLGLVAGEETGGPVSEYSEVGLVTLPYSGVQVRIASAEITAFGQTDTDRGVVPDVPIDPLLPDEAIVESIRRAVDTTADSK